MWHGPFRHSTIFNPYNNAITGYGADDVGEFAVSGYHLRNTLQIMIVQAYRVLDFVLALLINKFDMASSSIWFS